MVIITFVIIVIIVTNGWFEYSWSSSRTNQRLRFTRRNVYHYLFVNYPALHHCGWIFAVIK